MVLSESGADSNEKRSMSGNVTTSVSKRYHHLALLPLAPISAVSKQGSIRRAGGFGIDSFGHSLILSSASVGTVRRDKNTYR